MTHTGFGIKETTVHLRTRARREGFESDDYGPGLWKDHHYPNVLAGCDEYPPKGDPREAMHTLCYHDHAFFFMHELRKQNDALHPRKSRRSCRRRHADARRRGRVSNPQPVA